MDAYVSPEDDADEPDVPAPEPEPISDSPGFDLMGADVPSFASLQAGRAEVFKTRRRMENFTRLVEGLPPTGEEGRRRGLGLWVLGRYGESADALADFDQDDVAGFTRAKSLMCVNRYAEAVPIFERLSQAYPDEPRPRGGMLEARLETDLLSGEENAEEIALERLVKGLGEAPEAFDDAAEGHYMRARAAELRRDWEDALDDYFLARAADPTLRTNLFRAAFLAERCGLDEEAVEVYEELIAMKPCDRNALMNLGLLYEDLGRDQDAAACYDLVVGSFGTDERARLYLDDARSAMDMYYDEDLERKEDRLNQILRIPITDFELSVRARNCLNKMQITTLGDLVCRTEQELLSYKNFGETSLNEIKEILHSKGLRLGMPREEAVASIEAHAKRAPSSDPSDATNRPISELQLSIRARRTVEALGCLTIGEVAKHSAEELLGMPNFGVTSLQELKGKLTEYGLKLRGE